MPSPISWSYATYATLSGSQSIDALLGGTKWASQNLTYSFPGVGATWSTDPVTGYGSRSSGSEPWNISFAPLSASNQQGHFAAALQQWANVANLQFFQVADTPTSVGDIRAAFSYLSSYANAQAWSTTPGSSSTAGDVWFNSIGSSATDSWTPGSFSFFTALHEIGHTLGFKHPFYQYGTPGTVLSALLDTNQYTVMSYTEAPNGLFRTITYNADGSLSLQTDQVNPETPMVLDIAAMQYLYGANASYNTGDDIYSFDTAVPFYRTIWDAGGNDTVSVSNFNEDCMIDLTPGNYSSIRILSAAIPAGYPVTNGTAPTYNGSNNLGIAYGVTLENAIGGSGNDTLTGNGQSNLLEGAAGDDTLHGAGGDDTIVGGAGSDTAVYSTAHSRTVVSYSAAPDTYRLVSVSEGIDLVSGIEIFSFAGQEVAVSDLTLAAIVTGGTGDDILAGGAGNHIIDGMLGLDTVTYSGSRSGFSVRLSGANYIVSDSTDIEGTDELINIERLIFQDAQIAFDIDGVAGQAYRLYQAAFNRSPDTQGLTFWISSMDAGLTLTQTANLFTESAEFQSRYGVNPTDTDFITALYANTLHRMPDPSGFDNWMSHLASQTLTRPEALIEFSESAENYASVLGVIQNGIILDMA